MKFLLSLLMLFPLFISANNVNSGEVQHAYTLISADELMEWYDRGVEMVVIDARARRYYDGILLPGATWVHFNTPEQEIRKLIPDNNSLIVVYCSNLECPVSGWLADRMIAMGYLHIYKYPDGLDDWLKRGYPTVHE